VSRTIRGYAPGREQTARPAYATRLIRGEGCGGVGMGFAPTTDSTTAISGRSDTGFVVLSSDTRSSNAWLP
jgi:hypothetical protein